MIDEDLESLLAVNRALLRLRFPWWLSPFVMRGTLAVTLGRRIYIGVVPDAAEELRRLIRHELEHVRQINSLGPMRFYCRYAIEYARNIRAGMNAHDAYRSVSFEREAFAAEEVIREPDV